MYYFDEADAMLSWEYEMTIDDYYEYLAQQDIREIPLRKQNAKERLFLQLGIIAVIALILFFFGRDAEPLVYLVFAGVAVFAVLIFLFTYFYAIDNKKNIQGLLNMARKKKDYANVPMKVLVFDRGLVVTEGSEKWVVRSEEIENFYETDNLFVVNIKYGRNIASSSLEKIVIAKRAGNEEEQKLVRDTVEAMLRREAQLTAEKKAKKANK